MSKRTPRLVSIVAVDGHDERIVLGLAAGAARGLEPRLGTAILQSARDCDVRIAAADRTEAAESGVVAVIAGHTVVVGTAELLGHRGVSLATLGEWPRRLQERGQQVVFVSVDGRVAAYLGVADENV